MRVLEAEAEPNPTNRRGALASTPQLLAILDEDPDTWREAVQKIQAIMHQVRLRPGAGSMLWRRFGLLDEVERDAFFGFLTSGANLKRDHPILQLRTQLMRSNARGRKTIEDFKEVALIIKAWNLWRAGETVGNLSYKYGGLSREEWPLPR